VENLVTSGDPVLDQQRTAMRYFIERWREAERAKQELSRLRMLMTLVGGGLGLVVGWVARLFFVG
jgi:hypothetical protein